MTGTSDIQDTIERVVQHDLLTERQAEAYVRRSIAGQPLRVAADRMDITKQTVSDYDRAAQQKLADAEATLRAVEQAHQHVRLGADVSETDDAVVVQVADRDGEQHRLPFTKTTTVVGHDAEALLVLVYEARGALHGYYASADGEKFESTLWADGQPYNTFAEFDRRDKWESPEDKADTVLWRRTGGADD